MIVIWNKNPPPFEHSVQFIEVWDLDVPLVMKALESWKEEGTCVVGVVEDVDWKVGGYKGHSTLGELLGLEKPMTAEAEDIERWRFASEHLKKDWAGEIFESLDFEPLRSILAAWDTEATLVTQDPISLDTMDGMGSPLEEGKELKLKYEIDEGLLIEEDYRLIYRFNSKHREAIEASGAFCHSCGEASEGGDIKEWIDGGETALCPHCGIDTLLPLSCSLPLDDENYRDVLVETFNAKN